MSDEKSKDYETVNQTVLKVYELIPEAYRLKFRARKMSEGETHVEFVRNKERLFDKWVKAKNVCGDYEKFRQLMLLEEIKQCIHPDIQLFLDDQEIGDIYGAAEKADLYSLTHKISNKSFKQRSSYRPVKHDYYQLTAIAIVISCTNEIRWTTNQVTHLEIIDRRNAVIATKRSQ